MAAAADKAAELEQTVRNTLAMVAPGTELRDGVERVLRANTGALVVLGYDKSVEALCSGGFSLDTDFTATRLRELAKMDGAIIVDREVTRILRAAVQLIPDPKIETIETGTRHGTADRVARQTNVPVLSVSKSMNVAALYISGRRYALENSASILSRANQALATLERYKTRLDEVNGTLSALEIEDLVTVRDVAVVAQRLEMVRRIAREIESYVVELGTDGRLLSLQLQELVAGVDDERVLIVRDYLPSAGKRGRTPAQALVELDTLSENDLLDLSQLAKALGHAGAPESLDAAISPRGYRLVAKVPRLPEIIVDRLVESFGTLQRLLAASTDDLITVEGIGETRARTIRDSLSRLAETSILERYV